MNANHLKALEVECSQAHAAANAVKLETGELIWFAGRPAHADEGTVALLLNNGVKVVLRSADVAVAEKNEDIFLVGVRVGTSFIAETSAVLTAKISCDCSDVDGNYGTIAAPPGGPLPEPPGGPFCRWREKCFWYPRKDGTIGWLCIPYLECINPTTPPRSPS